jgi:BCD family chlorophyll transporter-like MFS transporter
VVLFSPNSHSSLIQVVTMSRLQIIRLSLVRFATSFTVVLLVAVLNRIMIADMGIARTTVGAILSLLHLASPLALYFGHLSDRLKFAGKWRTPYILVGTLFATLPLPFLPDLAAAIAASASPLLIILGVVLLLFIGFGITLSTITLHALIIDRCESKQRGEAMTLVWIITLVGFIIAAPFFSWLIPEYNAVQLRHIFLATAIATILLTVIGIWRQDASPHRKEAEIAGFRQTLAALVSNPQARILFIFLALTDFFFFSQEYVLEAFGKEVFGLSVSHTTSFNFYYGIGVLISMISVNAIFTLMPKLREKAVIATGTIIAGTSFSLLAWSTFGEKEYLLLLALFIMGLGKGVFNVGMARLMVQASRPDLGGAIMGLWAVVGGLAIGIGELSGAAIVDLAARITGSIPMGYGILFTIESFGLVICLFLIARFQVEHYHQHLGSRLPETISPDAI